MKINNKERDLGDGKGEERSRVTRSNSPSSKHKIMNNYSQCLHTTRHQLAVFQCGEGMAKKFINCWPLLWITIEAPLQ